MTRTTSLAWFWKAAVASSLLLSGSAWAQTATSNAPGGDPRNARIQAAYEQWRKLPQQEVRCVDQTLHARKSSVQALVQRGIGPSDGTIANLRAGCRTQAQAKPPAAAPAPVVVANAPKANPVKTVAPQGVEVQALDEYWSFNGSVLNSEAKGDVRKFYFFKPHPEIEATGAHRGALFAEGKVMSLEGSALSQRFVGQAFHFGGRCGAIPYRVDGTIRDHSRRLEWQGQKPRLDADCKVIGTDLDSLTLKMVTPDVAAHSDAAAADQAAVEKATADKTAAVRAEAVEAAAEKAAADKAAAEKAAAEKATAEKVAAEKAAVEKAAAEKVAAEKAKADKIAAEKAAAEKAATEKAAAKAATEKLAAEKSAAEKAAAEKAAAEKAAVEKAAAKAAAERAAAEQAAAEKAAAEKAAAEEAAASAAADHAGLGLADNAAIELMKANLERALTSAAAESRLSFIYGLISGPLLFGLGGLVFWLLTRKTVDAARSQAAYDRSRAELDRLTSAFVAGEKRGEAKTEVRAPLAHVSSPPTAPVSEFRELGTAWSRLHPPACAPQPRVPEKASARVPEKSPVRPRETQPAGADRHPL